MIRAFRESDMDDVIDVWLEASIAAHHFVEEEFWAAKVDDMRNRYIPASESYVFLQEGVVVGFFSLCGDVLAALFVAPAFQGQGIGRKLIEKAKGLRKQMQLTVYKENVRAVKFYKLCGFAVVREQIDSHTGYEEILMVYG